MRDPTTSKATLMACYLCFAQQATGINAIIVYSGTIFGDIGLSPGFSGVVINLVNLFGCVAAYPLPSLVGRKTILTVTFAGQGIALMCAAYTTWAGYVHLDDPQLKALYGNLGLGFVCIFLLFFQFGPGPVMWLYNAEICKGTSLTAATSVNWLTGIIIQAIFP